MKPPKCRNCGAEEWRHVCGGSNVSVGRSRVTRFDTPPTAEPRVSQSEDVSQLASTTYRYRDAEKRRAYQRDLMRSRRRAGRRVSP